MQLELLDLVLAIMEGLHHILGAADDLLRIHGGASRERVLRDRGHVPPPAEFLEALAAWARGLRPGPASLCAVAAWVWWQRRTSPAAYLGGRGKQQLGGCACTWRASDRRGYIVKREGRGSVLLLSGHVTRAVLGVVARHGVAELRGSSGEQDVRGRDVVGLEACCVFSC